MPIQTLGEGERSRKTTRRGVENALFSWREIAQCFWATGIFLDGKLHDHPHFRKRGSLTSSGKQLFDSTEVLNLRKTCNICKWKEKVQKNTGGRRKVQVTKAALKGLHLLVCFLHNGELAPF